MAIGYNELCVLVSEISWNTHHKHFVQVFKTEYWNFSLAISHQLFLKTIGYYDEGTAKFR